MCSKVIKKKNSKKKGIIQQYVAFHQTQGKRGDRQTDSATPLQNKNKKTERVSEATTTPTVCGLSYAVAAVV